MEVLTAPLVVGRSDPPSSHLLPALDVAVGGPSRGRGAGIRTLFIGGPYRPRDDEIRRWVAADEMPGTTVCEEAIDAFYIDQHLLSALPGRRGRLLRRLPYRLAQVIEAFRRRHDFDVLLTWGEISTILFAAAMIFWTDRPAHVAILPWPSKPKKAIPLRLLRKRIHRWIVPSPLQRLFAEERLGVPAERFVDARWPLDTGFWRPLRSRQDLICAVGQEMRDYATFVEALRPLDIPCHVAIGASVYAKTSEKWFKDFADNDLPPSLTFGPKSYTELRDLYASARFVVIPLRPSDNDSGISAIREAFAMGRTVIVTDTPGQVGILEDGVNCVRVPPFDPVALREAIVELWNDPERCARLGAAGRAIVEERHGLLQWTHALQHAVTEAVASRGTARYTF